MDPGSAGTLAQGPQVLRLSATLQCPPPHSRVQGPPALLPLGPDTALTPPSQATYDAFMGTSPSMEAFEAELRKYNALEQEIAAIPMLHNIGAAWGLSVCA